MALVLSLGTLFVPSLARADEDELQWTEIDSPELTNLCDIAVAPSPRSLFAATYNSTGIETVWRSAGTPLGKFWGSVLTIDTTSNRIILRLSPNYSSDYTIYVAEIGGDLIMVSHNRGNSWEERCAPGEVIDMTVEDDDTIYIALPGGSIQKSTDAAGAWQDPVDSELSEINMLTVTEEGTVLVGGSNGEVVYSLDGDDTFTKIPEDVGSGNVQIVADVNYGENGIIYAAANEGIYRWNIGVSTTWQRIVEEIGVVSLAVGSDGTLYALKPNEGVIRLLNPAASSGAEIDLIDLPAGNIFPILKLPSNSEQNELWVIDTASDIIYYFIDTLTLCYITPTLNTPSDGATIPLDPRGYVSQFCLTWDELLNATIYEVAIYLDSGCTERVWLGNSDTTSILVTDGDDSTGLAAGTTYYWRMRSIAPLKSLWAEPRSFTIGLGGVQATFPTSGTTGVPISNVSFTWDSYPNAAEYEFTLSQKADLTGSIVSEKVTSTAYKYTGNLEYSTSYFWGVKITKPALGPLSVFTFTTRAAPEEIPPPVRVEIVPPAQVEVASPAATPIWVWVTAGSCAALIAAALIFIFRRRAKVKGNLIGKMKQDEGNRS